MTSTTQPLIDLFKIIMIILVLILAPVALTYFTIGITSYAVLLQDIIISTTLFLSTASTVLIVVFKKEKIQDIGLLYAVLVCSIISIMLMVFF